MKTEKQELKKIIEILNKRNESLKIPYAERLILNLIELKGGKR